MTGEVRACMLLAGCSQKKVFIEEYKIFPQMSKVAFLTTAWN